MLAWCLATRAALAAGSGLAGGPAFEHTESNAFSGGTSLAEDAAGFIWLGTQTSLVRWDGHLERSFPADPGVPGALPDAYVRALHVDPAGRLWVATNAGGLARYEAHTERFERIADPQQLVGNEVAALAQRTPGSLWVAGNRGLAWLDIESSRLQREPVPAGIGLIKALRVARDGSLWLAGEGGLWRRPAAAADFVPVPLLTRDGSVPRASCLLEDGSGRMWVGTRLRGAYVVPPGAASARPVAQEEREDLATDSVMDLIEARPGEIWMATHGNGLVRVHAASGRIERERHDAIRPSSLVDNSVQALLRARSGLLWVATNYALSRHDPRQDLTDALYGGPGRPVRSDNVPAVLGLRDGRLWLATGEYGAQVLEPASGRVVDLQADPARPDTALPKARVIALTQGPDERVWIGTQGGLFRAQPDGSGLQRVPVPGLPPATEVWALHWRGGTLWVGGKDGLWALDASGPGAPRPLRRLEVPGRTWVTALGSEPGALWVGTNDGLGRLDDGAATITMLRSDPLDATATPGGMVSSLLFDRRGRLWVGIFGRGVQLARGQRADGTPLFHRFTTAEGLPHNGVDALLADADGHVWASTDDGLARIDAGSLEVRSFRAAQHVGILQFWTGAGTTLPSGELLFGGQGGLLVVHPERVRGLPPPPRPVLTEVRIGGQAVPSAALMDGSRATVPAEARSLMVEFASLAYVERDALRYAYRLAGFDADWVEVPAQRRLASYTNLPPGQYTLELRVAPRHGEWTAPLAVPLQVEARWYEHPLARLLAGLLLIGLVAAAVQLRTVVLRRGQARLEALVAQRTAELERRTEELRASQGRLEQMAYFDGLTGLANRRLFHEDLRRRIAETQRGGGGFVVVLIDLDRFKDINDDHGHDAGDTVLVATAQRLRQAVRTGDAVARLGGDEFVALLRPVDDGAAALDAICRRIVDELARPVALPSGRSVEIGASLGLARCPHDAADADALLKAADVALYEAKRAGRGQWRRWRAADDLDPEDVAAAI